MAERSKEHFQQKCETVLRPEMLNKTANPLNLIRFAPAEGLDAP